MLIRGPTESSPGLLEKWACLPTWPVSAGIYELLSLHPASSQLGSLASAQQREGLTP